MIIRLVVHPNSSKNSIIQREDGAYSVHVAEKAIDGKANKAVVKLVAKQFGVMERNVVLRAGSSRKKIAEIKDAVY